MADEATDSGEDARAPIERLRALAESTAEEIEDAEWVTEVSLALPDLIAAVEAAQPVAATTDVVSHCDHDDICDGNDRLVAYVVQPELMEALRGALAPLYRPQGPAGGEEHFVGHPLSHREVTVSVEYRGPGKPSFPADPEAGGEEAGDE